jgi:predicted MPP superfamily phosphohydrolase
MGHRESVTWLHLSDLHLCEPHNGPDRFRVLTELLRDLEALRDKERLEPDLLFVTGDLAYGNLGKKERSLPSQYDEVERFLRRVRKTFSIPRRHVFLVPGNHDVNRAKADPLLTAWAKKADLRKIEDMVRDGDGRWPAFLERLRDYRRFLERYGYRHLLGEKNRLFYAAKCSVNDLSVAVAGLNSAWSCGGKNESRIAMGGRRQIERLYRDLANADLKIALTHHPTNWLRTDEATRFEMQLIHDFHFHLHGHEHLAFVDPRKRFHRIAAGATYQQGDDVTDENSYNVVRIDLASGKGCVWLREFRDSEWGPKRVAPYTDNNGVWKLDKTLHKVSERFRAPRPPREELATRQEAAVCYRRTSNGLRFLLTLTSQDRWLFPKKKVVGDPPRQTARKAANEEAGAIGKLDRAMLTRFEYRKAGIPIMTDAYLFAVEKRIRLPRRQRWRRPTWYSPEEAVRALMEGRDPAEWWPLLLVVRDACERLES